MRTLLRSSRMIGCVSAIFALSCGSSGGSSDVPGDAATGDDAPGTDATSSNDTGTPGGDSGTVGTDTGPAVDSGPINAPEPMSVDIVVDQFGYRPADEKLAVIRDPQKGFDASKHFTPGAKYALVDAHSGARVLEAAPTAWNGGATDDSSGDRAWWFDFSSVTTPGDYYVLDESQSVRSPVFHVSDDVYAPVLQAVVRMFYYQRDGIAKDAKYAGAAWADGIAHPQDTQCALYSDGSGKKDLHGGWFDAGDQNRYTNWGASDVLDLLHAYQENPAAFGDATNIPESGNGVPDVLDEAKWELDWMVRMQNTDGSVLSIAGHDGASPPSADKSACKYGPANTSATLTTAAAFAMASRVFKAIPAAATAYPGFSDDLATRAGKAWTWAVANPAVSFYNGGNVGAGEQEVDDIGRIKKKLQASVQLFALTGDATYQQYFDGNYVTKAYSILGTVDEWDLEWLDVALDYAKNPKATASVSQKILAAFKGGVEGGGFFGAMKSNADPYLSHLDAFVWGSNQVKGLQGNMYEDVVVYGVDAAASADAAKYAERYVHYVHGVNPLQLVYLSNMGALGAETSVSRFYHSWFGHGTDWDQVGVSKYGPPPGYLPGGPNPSYTWDGCCPSGCGSAANNAMCGSAPPSPPTGQPDQKSYKDFNDNWPLDSWAITEPDDGYQSHYVRLLSKFVQ